MRCSLLTLSSYLDNELDATHRAEVDAHIVGCERCHKGLDYLREEISRISGLARVHLSDPAARTFLEQLGLIGPDDDLPPRPPRAPSPAPPGGPPWFVGGPAGGALPWAPRRPGSGHSDQPSLPFHEEAVLQPRGSPRAAAGQALTGSDAGDEAELHLSGRAASAAQMAEEASMASERADGASTLAPTGGTGLETEAPPSPWRRAPVRADVTGAEPPGRAPAAPAPGEDPWGWAPRDRPLPGAPQARPGAPPLAAPPSALPRAAPARPPGGEVRSARPVTPVAPGSAWPRASAPSATPDGANGSESRRGTPAGEPAPWPGAWGPERRDAGGPLRPWPGPTPEGRPVSPAPTPPHPPAPAAEPASGSGNAPLPRPASPIGAWEPVPSASGGPAAPAPPVRSPAGGVISDPLIAMAGPPRRARPGLAGRLRDALALRLALARGDRDQPPLGDGDPLPGFRGGSAPGRGRADPDVAADPGAAEPAIPMGDPGRRPVDGRAARAAAAAPTFAAPPPGARWPTTAEELPTPPPRVSAPFGMAPLGRGGDASPPAPGRHTRALRDTGLPFGLPAWLGRGRSRWVTLSAGAALILVVVLLITLPGGSSPTARIVTTPSSHPAASHAPGVTTPPATAGAPVVSPAASATPSASPSPTAAPVAAGPSHSYGAGGTGWQLDNLRCCFVQGPGPDRGDTRVVFDMSGSGAAPAMTVSFPAPTTMVVSFTGASATGTFASVSGGVIASMTPPSGSSPVFRFILSKAATVTDWNFLPNGDSSSPVPLIYFDLG